MRLLDLFCGAGGCSVGYARTGFEVVGVDIEPHPGYPFEFHEADALDVLDTWDLAGFDVIHASPPCHDFSDLAALTGDDGTGRLLFDTRERLESWGGLYVIENVVGSPLAEAPALFGAGGVLLCGSMFGLGADCRDGRYRYLQRHRLFESNAPLSAPRGCRHVGEAVGVYGTGGGGQMTRGYKGRTPESKTAMGIGWMTREELAQAIPPAYTEYLGGLLLDHLTEENAA